MKKGTKKTGWFLFNGTANTNSNGVSTTNSGTSNQFFYGSSSWASSSSGTNGTIQALGSYGVPVASEIEKVKIFCKNCDDKIAEFYLEVNESIIFSLRDSLCVKCRNIQTIKK